MSLKSLGAIAAVSTLMVAATSLPAAAVLFTHNGSLEDLNGNFVNTAASARCAAAKQKLRADLPIFREGTLDRPKCPARMDWRGSR